MNVTFASTRIAARWCYEKSIQNLQGKNHCHFYVPTAMRLKLNWTGFVQFVQLRNVKNFSITSLALCGVLVATISITPANLILDKEGSKSSLQLHIIVSTKKGEF